MSKEMLLPGTGGEYVPLFPLLANYWDKPLSELPEELRARVSLQKKKRLVGSRPKFDASGEFERDAEGHYPAWEEVYAEHATGDWIIGWDALTPAQRQELARQIDDRHDPEKIKAQQHYFDLWCKKDAIEREIGKWESMHHQNDPAKAKIQDDKLAELRDKLEEIEQRFKLPPPDAPAALVEAIRGITKQQVINAFEGIHFDREQWNKALGKNIPDWLKTCRAMPGKIGDNKTSATWNPVLIAAALYGDSGKSIPRKKLDAVFIRLKDWADEWHEVSALFPD